MATDTFVEVPQPDSAHKPLLTLVDSVHMGAATSHVAVFSSQREQDFVGKLASRSTRRSHARFDPVRARIRTLLARLLLPPCLATHTLCLRMVIRAANPSKPRRQGPLQTTARTSNATVALVAASWPGDRSVVSRRTVRCLVLPSDRSNRTRACSSVSITRARRLPTGSLTTINADRIPRSATSRRPPTQPTSPQCAGVRATPDQPGRPHIAPPAPDGVKTAEALIAAG